MPTSLLSHWLGGGDGLTFFGGITDYGGEVRHYLSILVGGH